MSIEPIFDLPLFGTKNPEKYLSKNGKIVFSKEFSSYQSKFLSLDATEEHEFLLQTCWSYLQNLDKQAREDIIKVLLENKPVAEALMMLTRLDMGLLEPKQYSVIFLRELNDYIEENKMNTSVILFLQKHFLNFERINPANYENYELTSLEYTDLISDYMKVQSHFFKR